MQYKVLINKVKGLRTLVPYNNEFYKSTFDKLIANPSEQYESIYIYNQEHYDQFKKTKSLAGISGVKTDKIVFDFDSKESTELALKDTQDVVKRLKADGFQDDEISVSYSGGKGFHVEIRTDELFSRDQFEAITHSYAGDLQTFDTTVSDEQRVFRMPLSLNAKTNRFKIPVPIPDLLNTETTAQAIAEYAAAPSFEEDKATFLAVGVAKNKFKVKAPEKKQKEEVVQISQGGPDFSKNKTGLTHAKYALALGYFEEGERHEAVMILSATYLALGWEFDNAYRNIKGTLAQRRDRLGLKEMTKQEREELYSEVSSVFSPEWKGGTYDETKNQLLIRTKKRFNIEEKFEGNLLVSLSQVDNIFTDFAVNIDKNTLKLGIPSFDDSIRVTTSTLVSLLAAPSVGKTSVTFGILNSTSKDNIKSMFFSLDMAAPQVYQRLAQKHTGLGSKELFKAFQDGNKAITERVRKSLAEEYANVRFCFKGAMNVDIIREAIVREKEMTGEYPKLVVIDYLENVMTSLSNDPTIAKGFVARALKDMANEFAICILLLVQPAKITGGPSEPLNSYYNIKGSGLVAEASSQVFTMHRPGFNPTDSSDDNYLNLTVVKNRMGELGSFDYHWTGLTGHIRELVQEEREHLEALRKQIAYEKSNLDSGGEKPFKRFGGGD